MRVLAIIPARSGSKGVPGKNSKELNGIPLIAYTINSAIQSSLLNNIVISTDDERCAEIAKSKNIEVPFMRPNYLSSDTTPTLPVIQHAVRFLEERGDFYDAICLLQPTTPFRKQGFIDKAINKFSSNNYDSLISVLKVPQEFNPRWVFFKSTNETLNISTGDEQIITRRQELPDAYFRDGSVYITKRDVIMEQNSLYGSSIGFIESNHEFFVNIDTIKDWQKAEKIAARIF